jgi:HSP20 family protein
MTALTKFNPFTTTRSWNPWRELDDLQGRINTMFIPTPTNGDADDTFALTGWSPVVDIAEDEKEYLIKAELPGLKKEDVKVTIDNGMLTITGERKVEKEEKNKKFHRVERSYGTFLRRFALPETAFAEKVNAEFKDGVLQVRLPKHESAKPKQVEVKVN